MQWKNVNIDGYPEDGEYVLIGFDFGIAIGQFIDEDWDTVGTNRKHFVFTKKEKLFSSCHPQYWMPLPKPPKKKKKTGKTLKEAIHSLERKMLDAFS